jgi:ADP-ribose pyrophosphatase YjhB (NUDIX family)
MENQKPITRVSAGGVVIGPQGKILVVSQHGNSWSLPKGGIDPDENEISAAEREIYEESGVRNLVYIKPLGTYGRFRIGKDGGEDKNTLKIIKMFLFTTSDTELKPIDPENPEAKWIDKDEVAGLLTHPKDKEFFTSIEDKI